MKSVFVDTNVLIYMRDPGEPAKREAARAWVERLAQRGSIVISPQVLNEFLSVSLRRFDETTDEIVTRARFLAAFCKAETTARTALRALELREGRMVSWWDALLLASALEHGCEMLLSEDLHDGWTIEGLRVLNPFTADINTVLRDI